MKLLATRDMNVNDPLPGLGKVLPRPPAPEKKAQPSPTNPQVIIQPDGKRATVIPGNEAAKFPSKVILGPIRVSSERQIKVGDRVRILSGQLGVKPINQLVGTVRVVEGVAEDRIILAGWYFFRPGVGAVDGILLTEFAE